MLPLFHSTLEGNFMPWGDILKPGGVLEIALYVAGLVRNKIGLGHGVYLHISEEQELGCSLASL